MTEPGSDDLLARATELDKLALAVRVQFKVIRDRRRRDWEEQRVRNAPTRPDPGRTHLQPDAAPPAHETHPEFETLPPV
jgi:hypothetical protein